MLKNGNFFVKPDLLENNSSIVLVFLRLLIVVQKAGFNYKNFYVKYSYVKKYLRVKIF